MTPEDEEFNRIEQEAEMRRKAVRAAIDEHREHLRKNMSEYERGFIDGMQKQMQSSVDRAVNAMPQRTWVGLERSDMPDGADPLFDDPKFIAGMVYAANKLMEKNT